MSRRIAYLSFTDRGAALAEQLRAVLGGRASRAGETGYGSLAQWTQAAFQGDWDALVFVGATGIAVRAVAPWLKSKAEDPAVVAVDETGRFAVPLVSGHLGGANDLARAIGRVCGAAPVITTATDRNGVFPVDQWARRQGCAIPEVWKIKKVSARLLAGEEIQIRSAWPVEGMPPEGVSLTAGPGEDVTVDLCRGEGNALPVVPRAAVLGVGCRRGISEQALETAFAALCEDTGLWPQAVCGAATIDLKAEETGLIHWCAKHGWPLTFYTPAQLREAEGRFTASAFVARTTGVDNVCERGAVLAAGGPLWARKHGGGGVTMAVARKPLRLDWSWLDG